MTTYYVGPGGNDGNTGLSWAARFLTLNGAEDEPVVANDTVYVGPGVYREMLTCDVSGGAGTPITYIADVTGEHTDGVGGIVRITGSDDDRAETRANIILADAITYRTFRGFHLDISSAEAIDLTTNPTNWIIEDCAIGLGGGGRRVYLSGDTQANCTIRRCWFYGASNASSYVIEFESAAGLQDSGHLVENCVFVAGGGRGVDIDDVGGILFKNNTFVMCDIAIRVTDALPGGYVAVSVTNSIFEGNGTALQATVAGEIVEDYNTFYHNNADRTTVNVGVNSVTNSALLALPILHAGASQTSGFRFPWMFGELSEWSQIRASLGADERTVDLFGNPRPSLDVRNSWGAIQFVDRELESGTVQAGSYGRVIHWAGQTLVRRIPTDNTEITVTLYMRYSTNYEGNLPRMVIRQPGQADSVDTMVAAVNTWEQLSITLTPAALPPYIEVWAESRHVPTSVDSQQGNLSYTTDGAEQTFTDDAQDFSDYDVDPTGLNALATHYILVTNNDGTTAMGWIREVGAGGNTEITICNQRRLNDNGTIAPAMWIGQYSAKTPSSYAIFECADVYFDTMDVS